MKDNKDFEYTQDNYIEDYRRNKMLLGLNIQTFTILISSIMVLYL